MFIAYNDLCTMSASAPYNVRRNEGSASALVDNIVTATGSNSITATSSATTSLATYTCSFKSA
jgi:hypothetical protein